MVEDKISDKVEKSINKIKNLLSRYFLGLLMQISILLIIYSIVLAILDVQNAFVITSYTGSDPEPALFDLLDGNPLAPGIDRRNSYYSNRSFTLGLNVKF